MCSGKASFGKYGFSVFELIVVIFLVATVFIMLHQVCSYGISSSTRGTNQLEMMQNSGLLLRTLQADLQNSLAVDTKGKELCVSFSENGFFSPSELLGEDLPSEVEILVPEGTIRYSHNYNGRSGTVKRLFIENNNVKESREFGDNVNVLRFNIVKVVFEQGLSKKFPEFKLQLAFVRFSIESKVHSAHAQRINFSHFFTINQESCYQYWNKFPEGKYPGEQKPSQYNSQSKIGGVD